MYRVEPNSYILDNFPDKDINILGTSEFISDFDGYDIKICNKDGDIVLVSDDTSIDYNKIKQACEDVKKGGKLFEGLIETLEELKKDFKLYIVSNCQNGYIETFLRFYGLENYFCDFENPDERCLSKGENIKAVLERNGFKNSIYVGDTQGDADAAKFAGIPFIYSSYGFGKVDSPDFTISSLSEIADIVTK